jgi:hypothetical protein
MRSSDECLSPCMASGVCIFSLEIKLQKTRGAYIYKHDELRPHAHIWSRCRCRPRVLASGRALALAQSLHAQAMGQTDMLGYYIAKNTSGACLCLLHALFNLAHGRSNQPLYFRPLVPTRSQQRTTITGGSCWRPNYYSYYFR